MLHHFEPSFSSVKYAVLLLFLLFTSSSTLSQDLPKTIRGYKVRKSNVSVKTPGTDKIRKTGIIIVIDLGKPKFSKVTPFGITFEILPKITVHKQSGRIDFITFANFTVNGLEVRIHEYKAGFSFRKNKLVVFRTPIKVFVGSAQTIRGAIQEILRSEKEWRVVGRAFVFGRYKKSFVRFKRVIPVNIDIVINNPARI